MKHAQEHRIRSLLTTLLAHNYAGAPAAGRGAQAPFVTISRQAGAGGRTLASDLVKALNARDAKHDTPWHVWDHELVEKVSAEHQIPEEVIDTLEDTRHPWFSEFISGLSANGPHDDFKVYRRVAVTLRALALSGRGVIVGRGGVFITAGIPNGIHVRLVAPLEHRIQRTAERLQLTHQAAAARVREIDRNREAFYRRYWPSKTIAPETFTLTLNTAELSETQLVECLLPLLTGDAKAHAGGCNKCAAAADSGRDVTTPCRTRRNSERQEPATAAATAL